ncbi:MAG TPA: tryptophan--tRNA ligase, partial [Duganella sp.]|nr:tryptophan--tRNA ligase [Duganella sp.]
MSLPEQSTTEAVAVAPKGPQIILTGDRPTGPLHLGHFVGSLRNRVEYQHQFKQFIMLADSQALTDNMDDTNKVHRNVVEVALDYLAVGIDPAKSTILIQSQIPELAELTFYYLNMVTVARLERNPTVKTEIALRGFERDIPAGFLTYP